MSDPSENHSAPSKVCFVTIGATASFSSLIRAAVSQPFVDALTLHNYTDLIVQYGSDGQDLYVSLAAALSTSINVKGFGLDERGLHEWMVLSKTGGGEGGVEGVVVSHAGSGTILDALRIDVSCVVVPNEDLLDNHQVELAVALAGQGYVVHGRLEDLPAALSEAEKLKGRRTQWPPVNSGTHRQAKGFQGVVDEELGFLD